MAATPVPFRRLHILAPALLTILFASATPVRAQGGAPLTPDDLAWLRRDTFGLDSATLERYREVGRKRFLDEQLAGGDDPLPPAVAPLINSYEAYTTSPAELVGEFREQRKAFKASEAANTHNKANTNAATNTDANADAKDDNKDAPKDDAKKAFQMYRRTLYKEGAEVELLRAIYGQNQLKEQMVWFWLNHFSIYAAKGGVGLFSVDYEEHVIRPNALGKFRDLLMATLQSPAMQLYLDNARNVQGKTNENYARELMELHTLGVNAGYTQQDVQQLALILTGAGVIQQRGEGRGGFFGQRAGFVRDGLFVFNPNKHDYTNKVFLGNDIKGSGYDEIKQAVDLIVQQPACATFVSKQIAQYFVADDPPPALVDAMAKTFRNTDGDIAAVLRTMFLSKYIDESDGKKFKDPTQFLVSAMRFSYDGKPIANAAPLVNWLGQMGEQVYGRITPDGWALDGSSWSGSGQMAKRFDVARAIGSGKNRLFVSDDDNLAVPTASMPVLNTALYQQTLEPYLSDATRSALGKAASQAEWNTFLLSSPDFNYR